MFYCEGVDGECRNLQESWVHSLYTHYLSYKKVHGSIGTVSSGFYTTKDAVQRHVDALESIAIEGSIVVAEL